MRLREAWYILREVGLNYPTTDPAKAMTEVDHILHDLGAETQMDRIRRQMEEV